MKSAHRISALLLVSAVLALAMTAAGVIAWLHLDAAGDEYTRALNVTGDETDGVARQVGLALRFDVATAAVLCLVSGYLARMLRFPLAWARVATWVVTATAWVALGCGLAAPPEVPTWTNGMMSPELESARVNLLLGWYPSVHSLLALAVLAVLTTAAVLLLRTAAQDFYRGSNEKIAPDWGAYGRDHG